MNKLERNAVIVIIGVLLITNIVTASYTNNYHTQIGELKTENQRLLNEIEPCLEEIAYLEHTIEIIVMERTMYIELSFTEIQRLRTELNITKQIIAEMNQNMECIVTMRELGPLKGILNVITTYENGSIVTRSIEVDVGGGSVITWRCN